MFFKEPQATTLFEKIGWAKEEREKESPSPVLLVLIVVRVLACGKHGCSDVFGVRGSDARVGVAAYFGIREKRLASLLVD